MKINKLNSKQRIICDDNLSIGDFWSWAYSDILSNRNRSVFAEFIVGAALKVLNAPRIEWDAYDLIYKEKKIEVKSAAFIQSWQQEKPSQIRFDISKKQSWYAENNTYSKEPTRSSDYFIFCLYPEKDIQKLNILNLDEWEFYILTKEFIEMRFKSQKSISLTRLKKYCSPMKYSQIKDTLDNLLYNI